MSQCTANVAVGSFATETRRLRHVRYSPKCCRNIALQQLRQCTEFGPTAKEPESFLLSTSVSRLIDDIYSAADTANLKPVKKPQAPAKVQPKAGKK